MDQENVVYIHTIEFYTVTKKNEIKALASKWMDIENIMLSQINQTQKIKCGMLSFICKC